MIKKTFILFFIFLISHCGFTPIYNSKIQSDYKIIISQISGDKYINQYLNNYIKNISNIESKNKFILNIETSYEKSIVSKDSKGSPTEYEISITSKFIINNNKRTRTVSFDEKQIIKNISDIFELKNYENSIKENFVNMVVGKLNLELVNY